MKICSTGKSFAHAQSTLQPIMQPCHSLPPHQQQQRRRRRRRHVRVTHLSSSRRSSRLCSMLRSSASVSAASVAACQSSEPIGIVSVAEPPCAAEVGGEDCRTVETVSPVPVQMWEG